MEKSAFFISNSSKLENQLCGFDREVKLMQKEELDLIAEGDIIIFLLNQASDWTVEKKELDFLEIRKKFFYHVDKFFKKYQTFQRKIILYSQNLIKYYFNREYLWKKFVENKKLILEENEKQKMLWKELETGKDTFSKDLFAEKQFQYDSANELSCVALKMNKEILYCMKVLDSILFDTYTKKSETFEEIIGEHEKWLKGKKEQEIMDEILENFDGEEDPDMIEMVKQDVQNMYKNAIDKIHSSKKLKENEEEEEEQEQEEEEEEEQEEEQEEEEQEEEEQEEEEKKQQEKKKRDEEEYCLAKNALHIHHGKDREMILRCIKLEISMRNLIGKFLERETLYIMNKQGDKSNNNNNNNNTNNRPIFYQNNSILVPYQHNCNNENYTYFSALTQLHQKELIIDPAENFFKTRTNYNNTNSMNTCVILFSVVVTSLFNFYMFYMK